MSNDVSIDVQVRDQSGPGFTAVNAQIRTLKAVSESAAGSLRTLTTRAGTAALSVKNVGRDAEATTRSLADLRAAAGDVRIRARVDDGTGPGADAVKAAVDRLKALGPVTLDVRFSGAAGDITATSDALKSLKDTARDAGQSTQALGARADTAAAKLEALKLAAEGAADKIDHLRDSAATAAIALTELRERASRAATAVGSLRDRADAAGTRVDTLAGHTRTLRTDLDDLHTSATRTSGSLGGLRGSLGSVTTSSDRSSGAVGHLTAALISLAPAAVPVAASLAPVVTATGAAMVALGAFGAAVIPQIKQLGDLSDALDTLAAAQGSNAAMTQKQVQAQQKAAAALSGVPVETQRAAAAFGDLKTTFNNWSASLAKFTLDPVTKSFAVAEAILPKLSPLVKDTSTQLSRLMTVAGGGVSTPGFDALMGKFSTYTNKVLKGATDETIHLLRVLQQGSATGPVSEFMAYAKSEGPRVKQTLMDLATAVGHIVQAASVAGPGLLTIVDAMARLISAVPPELLGRLMQLYTAFKLIKLAGVGLTSVATGAQSLAAKLTALRAASAAAGGGLAGVRAALATLSTGTKVTGAIAVVAGLALALKSLQGSGKAAPDVARMTTAIGELGRTGKVTGEAARVFGGDFDKLNQSIDRLNGGGSKMDHFNDTMNKIFTLGHGSSNSLKDAKKDIDAVDKALAQLVQNGQADIAAAAVTKLGAEYAKTGKPTKELTDKLDAYKSALADAKFESELTADSMGLFGKQAQDVQQKLNAQKQSADGLRQSIQALNDVNRAGIDGMIGFEQAIADGNKSLKENGKSLRMVNGQLVLTSQKARDEASALNDLAAKTDSASAAARDQGKSWGEVYGIYDRGRTSLINLATSMGLTKDQTKQLANQILQTPDKTAYLKGNIQDLQAKIASAKKQLAAMPKTKTTALKATSAQLLNVIRDAQAKIDKLHGKSIDIIATYSVVNGQGTNVFHEGGGYAHGGVIGAAAGGPRSRLTLVGEQGPELVDLAAGSRVRTANATRQILSGASGGSAQPILVQFVLDSRVLAEQLLVPQRDLVQRIAGGDVQKAFGGRTR